MVGIAMLFQIVTYGGALSTFSFWVSHWMRDFGSPRAPIMMAPALVMAIASLLAPLVGRLADRIPIQIIPVVGLSSFAIGLTLVSKSTSVWQAVVTFGVMMGIGVACAGPLIAQTLTAKWFSERLGLATGIVVTGPTLGGILISQLLVTLLDRHDWRSVALMLAACTLPVIALILLFVRNGPYGRATAAETRCGAAGAPLATKNWTTRQLLANPNFWPVLFAFVPQYLVIMAIGANLTLMFADHGLTPADAALSLGLLNVVAIAGKILVGRLSDSIDHRLLIVATTTMSSIGFLLMLGDADLNQMRLSCIALGIGTAGFYPMQGAVISRYFGTEDFGRILGLLTFFFLFSALGAPLAGAMRDHFGDYVYFQLGAAILLPISGMMIFRLKRQGS